jgi:hypothetical protein
LFCIPNLALLLISCRQQAQGFVAGVVKIERTLKLLY